jgi:hypothetical protein
MCVSPSEVRVCTISARQIWSYRPHTLCCSDAVRANPTRMHQTKFEETRLHTNGRASPTEACPATRRAAASSTLSLAQSSQTEAGQLQW